MNRIIPSKLTHPILFPLTGRSKDIGSDELIKKIMEYEVKCEESIISTFKKVDIHGMTKSNRYSLPYNEEIITTLMGESYLNGPYEFHRVARPVLRKLLDDNLYKVRFYFFIEIDDKLFGKVIYHFRYHIPK